MNRKIKAGIAGGAGYTGGELIRLLLRHPQAEIAFVHSKSNAGKPLHTVHTDLLGDTDLLFASAPGDDIDVLFLCAGHGEARQFLQSNSIAPGVKIIDLSQDFRLAANAQQGGRSFVYGLPELQKEAVIAAQNIANPGCFATAIQLALLPLAIAGMLPGAYVTGITGSTGAGQSLSATSHFSWRAGNISAYKTLQHQHLHEIAQSLGIAHTQLHFVPWRGDFTRGIYISAVVDCTEAIEALYERYRAYYAVHPFTHVSSNMIDLKQVVNTNKCLIHLERQGNKLAVHAAIDNLLKGASGQAVQNMNLLFGLEETAGLQLKASHF